MNRVKHVIFNCHHAFVVDMFIQNQISDCYTKRFLNALTKSTRHSTFFKVFIFLLVKNFQTSESELKRKQSGRPQTIWTTGNKGSGKGVHSTISKLTRMQTYRLGFLINIARCLIPSKGPDHTNLCTMFGFNKMEQQLTLACCTVGITGEKFPGHLI